MAETGKLRIAESAPTGTGIGRAPSVTVSITGKSSLPDESVTTRKLENGSVTLSKLSETLILPVEKGGTGAIDASEARKNLGAAPEYVFSTEELTESVSELATGMLYFVYE